MSTGIDISIVIVNYNVKHFLDQCLRSVLEAKQHLSIEVFVVDNDSIDGSVEHVKKHFPWVLMYDNKENLGFAKANNQAIRESSGKYVLLLNPDTIIEKDTLVKCFAFMEEKISCGALGVKMIDGEGKFLPESKRGFPTPFASLTRLTGLSKLFPESKVFNKYNLGYLSENEVNEVDVLSGAFMFMRKKALDEVGLLDEAFFMYGEDIDLSYRIQKGGYEVFYYPESSIVHFKGESTKKSSLKYYSTFYKAMAIFAKKHYGGGVINPFLWLVNGAILMIAVSNYLWRVLSNLVLPLLEFALFFCLLNLIQILWAAIYYHDPNYYSEFDSTPIYFFYSLIWVLSLWISASYRSPLSFKRLLWGILGGTLVILIFYALMGNDLRNSRAVILISSFVILPISIAFRYLLRKIFGLNLKERANTPLNVLVVGDEKAVAKTREIMDASPVKQVLKGVLASSEEKMENGNYLQRLSRIEQVVEVYKIDEVFFAADQVPMSEIMKWMTILGSKVKIKIISKDVQSIIGSHDRNSKGDLYTIELKYRINLSYNHILKNILDKVFAIMLLLLSPILILLKLNFSLLTRVFYVLSGKKSWVSYFPDDNALDTLPSLKEGYVPPVIIKSDKLLSLEELHSINFYYARDYNIGKDIEIILLNLSKII